MKNYVISLANADKRRQHIIKEFGKQNIEFEFFDAVTPNTLSQDALSLNLSNVFENQQLSQTEKACFFSHVALMKLAMSLNLPYISIFEDDVYLGNQAKDYLTFDNHLKDHNIELLKLETFLQYRKVDKKRAVALHNGRTAYPLKEYHLGMAGYIISQSAIRQFLSYVETLPSDKIIPIDRLLFDKFMACLDIYQLYPALCIQEHIKNPTNIKLPSTLEQERRLHHKQCKPKRPPLQKLKSELVNLFKKTIGKLIRLKISFY